MSSSSEYAAVEEPLLDPLVLMGWQHTTGNLGQPSAMGRASFREVLLRRAPVFVAATARFRVDHYVVPTDLARLDWAAIDARQWNRTAEDLDRQRRKEAEFLAHRRVALSEIRGVVVCDDRARGRVSTLLAAAGVDLPIAVRPAWYY